MFVYPNSVLVKTCGTTTLLKICPSIIQLAKVKISKFISKVFRFQAAVGHLQQKKLQLPRPTEIPPQ